MNWHAVSLVASLSISVVISSAAWSVTIDNTHVIGNQQDANGTTIVARNPNPTQLLTDPSQAFKDAMTNSKAAADWWGTTIVTFNWTGSLSGTFHVDVYNAAHTTATRGGAEFLLHYNRGAGDPAAANLFWVQTVDSSFKNGGETIPYPDVYFSNYPAGAKLPFFFRPDEVNLDNNPYVGVKPIRSSNYTVGGVNYTYDLAFWDFPQRDANAYWRGELFLATYDPNTKFVQVYDGVRWGFDIATPIPPAFALFFFPALLLAWRAGRATPAG